ncbi:succinate dehydrogenase subunit 4, putative [Plasmodium ovale]|uniref:Succinate dehydrogenase subunit 4, putative n=1 Tax=Plasmodium ovale TaxID=36330 RepID=A0A1D3TGL3_PLAOA|nr:succinate dehydrogenase subunit 4, putative [Plasmodium ovale]
MKFKLSLAKKKKGFDCSIIEGCKSIVNKLFGSGVDKYFKAVNISIIVIFVTVLNYIYNFDIKKLKNKDKNLLYMYYGFLACLVGFAISINWIYFEYSKNKKKRISPLDVKMGSKKK